MVESTLGTFADIVVPLALPKLFTYRIPQDLSGKVKLGCRVIVQFGAKRVYAGIVWNIHHQPPQAYEAKYILDIVDDDPILPTNVRKLWDFISAYYMCSLGEVMIAGLPSGLKLESETKIVLREDQDDNKDDLTDHEFLIIEALETSRELSVQEAMDIVQLQNVYKILHSLFKKGRIFLREEVIHSYKPKTESYIILSQQYATDEALSVLMNSLEKSAPRQLDLLLRFYQLKGTEQKVKKSTLMVESSDHSAWQALKKKGVFEEMHQVVSRFDMSQLASEPFHLNQDQKKAVKSLKEAFKEKDVALLFGVTSSGKTHVYVHLIEEMLKEGKQVLFLLPEIGLTGQMVERLRKFFGARVMVTHSRFSENERVEIWQKVQDQKVNIIIGPRSALFLPFQNLGLIIVDEEHDPSYKQNEPAPRYHGRDSAIMLGRIHQCPVLLGSATPSLESYFLAIQDKYGLVEMKQRHGGVQLPDIQLADVAVDKESKLYIHHFTKKLRFELQETIDQHKQAIIFLNRRGYIPLLECEHCGWVPKCIQCDVSLTLHKYNNSLKCHFCGYSKALMTKCEACHSPVLQNKGFGTEMIQEDLQNLFPKARISRMDLETTRNKGGHQKIIRDLQDHKTDILVGTQMVSKGLDFESVTLVGVVSADQILNFPDFRAHERTFQLLSQVSGRAGRRSVQGKVIIQTAKVMHPVLQFVVQGDYEGFYAYEILQRQRFRYPPYFRLIQIICKDKSETKVDQCAKEMAFSFRQQLGDFVLGPEAPMVSKVRNMYLRQILIKIDRKEKNMAGLKIWMRHVMDSAKAKHKSVIIIPDVDPIN